VAYLKVTCQYSRKYAEENHDKPQSRQSVTTIKMTSLSKGKEHYQTES